MSMYGKYPKNEDGSEQQAWPATDFTGDKGFTVQADRDEADINKVIARFNKSGQLPPTFRGEPFYGDVSEFGDLRESLIKIQEADELFMALPAVVRERFENKPANMIDFLSDEGNREEAEELGLVVPRPKPVEPVPPVNPADSKPV